MPTIGGRVVLPSAPAAYDPKEEAQNRRTIMSAIDRLQGGLVSGDVMTYINAKDYGVVGDGVADDTTALQAALTAGYTSRRVVNCGALICKISAPAAVTAGAFVVGTGYTIKTVGSTDFTLIGASANTVGVHFVATGVGSGTGTATPCALTVRGPGLVFDFIAHGDNYDGSDITTAEPGILATGTGYTAVLIAEKPQYIRFGLYGNNAGARPVLNGVVFQNAILCVVNHLRVNNLDGFGVKINKCWDGLFDTISVGKCGNDSQYAFSMNDDGSTCNEMHITRLQVEESTQRVINISGNSLSIAIDKIHSERAVCTAVTAGSFVTGMDYTITTVGTTNFTAIGASANTVGVNFVATGAGSGTGTATPITWMLGGGASAYTVSRFHAASGTGKVWLKGANTTFTAFRTESGTNIDLEAITGTSVTLIDPDISGTIREIPNQSGMIVISGGKLATIIANWTGNASNRYITQPIEGTWTPTLTIGGSSAGITYSADRSGQYTRIGRTVLATCTFTLTSRGGLTGDLLITGLPYTAAETAGVTVAFYVNVAGWNGFSIVGQVAAGATAITLNKVDSDVNPTWLNDTNITDTTRLILSVVYRTTGA
jgi:hypothetical protein